MKSQILVCFRRAFYIGCTIALVGCGGGGGGRSSSKAIVRAREIASTRLTRSTLTVAGLGRKTLTKSVGTRGSRRMGIIFQAMQYGRGTSTGFDSDTNLYYTLTTAADGSGSELLFADAAHQVPGGSFVWAAPQRANGVVNTYPAVFHIVFNITQGDYSGNSGTMDVTLNDAAGVRCLVHIALKNLQNERCTTDFNINSDLFTANSQIYLTDGSNCDVQEAEGNDGAIMCIINWPDGSSGTLSVSPDGTVTTTVIDPSGNTINGTVNPDGMDTINYPDGSSEVVNDNTEPESSSNDNSNQSLKVIRSPAKTTRGVKR